MTAGRKRALAAVTALVVVAAMGVMLLAADFIYAMFVAGAWRPNHWLDRAHIPRETSDADPELGFVRKPHLFWTGELDGKSIVYRTDQNGFRNASGITQADIAVIGDSFTEASHVSEEESFVQRIARGAGMRAVNLGRGGYGPQQELIVLRRYALQYRPKLIIWQFFTGNDVSDAEEYADWERSGRRNDVPLLTRWMGNSLLREVAIRVLKIPSLGAAPATLRYTDGSSERLHVRYQREPAMPARAVSEIDRTIAEAARLCAGRGSELVVISIPTMLQALQPYIEFDDPADRARFRAAGSGENAAAITLRVRDTCVREGCTAIDMFPPLRHAAARDNRRLYIPGDEHLDTRGHQVVARAVLDYLQSSNAETQRRGEPLGASALLYPQVFETSERFLPRKAQHIPRMEIGRR